MKQLSFIFFICACMFAMGDAIRSTVGATHSRFVHKSDNGPTASDYIQDGLISIWDGEWNGGIGIHDALSPIWKNLIADGADIPTTLPSLSWGDKCLVRDGVDGISFLSGIDLSDPISPRTLEIVFSAEGFPVSPSSVYYIFRAETIGTRVQYASGGKVQVCLRAAGGYIDSGLTGPSIETSTLSMVGTTTQLLSDIRYAYYYTNGIKIGQGLFGRNPDSNPQFELFSTTGRDWPEENIIRIFCIRFYNRALTETEVLHNHEIDDARFNQ